MVVESAGQRYILMGQHLTPLQALDRNTAENLSQALQDHSDRWGVGRTAAFQRRVRVSLIDSGSNNLRAERAILQSRPERCGLQITRDIHRLANLHSKVFDLASEDFRAWRPSRGAFRAHR